jgi:hypothetical protein
MAHAAALGVSLSELIDVLDDVSSWTRFHYLDRETGAVETGLTEEVDESGNFADVRADTARFVVIKPLPTWLRLKIRETFVERCVDDPTLRLDLAESLVAPKPLFEFQKQLRRQPHLLDAFAAFRLEALNDAAKEWLAENKVRPPSLPMPAGHTLSGSTN